MEERLAYIGVEVRTASPLSLDPSCLQTTWVLAGLQCLLQIKAQAFHQFAYTCSAPLRALDCFSGKAILMEPCSGSAENGIYIYIYIYIYIIYAYIWWQMILYYTVLYTVCTSCLFVLYYDVLYIFCTCLHANHYLIQPQRTPFH